VTNVVLTPYFREDRWTLAGATGSELWSLQYAFESADPDAQAIDNEHMAAAATDEITTVLSAMRASGSYGLYSPPFPGYGQPLFATGGTMTGPLILNADPALPLGAATKQYVDAAYLPPPPPVPALPPALPINWVYAGGATDIVESLSLTGDAYARWYQRADGRMSFVNPVAPLNWGDHVAGAVGTGHDYQWGWESSVDTAYMHYMSFPRIHLTDGAGNFFYLTASPGTWPITGATLHLGTISGSMSALGATGTLAVSSVGLGTGTVAYTSVNVGAKTISGCTSTGLTTSTDITQRYAIWLTDGIGAPIFWLANYGGMYVNDQINFRWGGVYSNSTYDITIGFMNDANPGSAGSGIFFGHQGTGNPTTTSIYHTYDGYGNSQLNFFMFGLSGSNDYVLSAAGFYPGSVVNLGTIYNPWFNIYLAAVGAAQPMIQFGLDGYVNIARGESIYSDGEVLFNTNGANGPTIFTLGYVGFYPNVPRALGTALNPWGTVYAQNLVLSTPTSQIGQLAGTPSVATSAYQNTTATGGVLAPADTSGGGPAPTITLPNDGHTYRVEFNAGYWSVSTNSACYLVLYDVTHSLGLAGIQASPLTTAATPVGTLVATGIIGSGQVIKPYTASASAGYQVTIGCGAGGANPPSTLAAYRVA
jgi:hypothetical protein